MYAARWYFAVFLCLLLGSINLLPINNAMTTNKMLLPVCLRCILKSNGNFHTGRFLRQPMSYCSNCVACFNYQLLVLCGDVELNPGPLTGSQEGNFTYPRRLRSSTKDNVNDNHEQNAIKWIQAAVDQPGFELKFINKTIGKGIFTCDTFPAGSFLLEYRGERISRQEAYKREKKYSKQNKGSYMFFYRFTDKLFCIDATLPARSGLCRYVNDSKFFTNCEMRQVVVEGTPHLCLFATKEISSGEELRYNYGVEGLWWHEQEAEDLKRQKMEKKKDRIDGGSNTLVKVAINEAQKESEIPFAPHVIVPR